MPLQQTGLMSRHALEHPEKCACGCSGGCGGHPTLVFEKVLKFDYERVLKEHKCWGHVCGGGGGGEAKKPLPHGKVSEAHAKELGLEPGEYKNKPGVGIMGQSHADKKTAKARNAETNAEVSGNRADTDSKNKRFSSKDKASLHNSAAKQHAEAAKEYEAIGDTEKAAKHKEKAKHHREQVKHYKASV